MIVGRRKERKGKNERRHGGKCVLVTLMLMVVFFFFLVVCVCERERERREREEEEEKEKSHHRRVVEASKACTIHRVIFE